MAAATSHIPEGFRAVTPHMIMKGAGDAIEFYKKAFGAEEIMRMPGPDGKSVMHAEIRIGDCVVMLADEMPMMDYNVSPSKLGGTTVALSLYVPDTDAAFKRAIDAGATESMKPMDMFWGDRYSKVLDPFGHEWEICTHKEDLTPEEIGKRAQEWMSSMGNCDV